MPLPRTKSPLLAVGITYEPNALRGVRVEARPVEEDVKLSAEVEGWKTQMEEVVRRGGARFLPGWIWKQAR